MFGKTFTFISRRLNFHDDPLALYSTGDIRKKILNIHHDYSETVKYIRESATWIDSEMKKEK
jgi:hypothetical protein